MANLTTTVLRSRAIRALVATAENKFAPLREWHRFEYQEHFGQTTFRPARMFSGVYPSVDEALSAMPKHARVGYDHEDMADRHTSEGQQVWPSDYPVLFWLKSLLRDDSVVFDLGGSTGISYYAFDKYLGYPQGLSWTVCEVPAVVRRGEEIAKERGECRLQFTTRFEDANDADVCLVSGALQFFETPLHVSLAQLIAKPRHLLINRTPFCPTPSFVTLHNLGPSICVYRILNFQEFVGNLVSIGYSLVDRWKNAEFSCYIPFHPDRAIEAYEGMYFRLDAATT